MIILYFTLRNKKSVFHRNWNILYSYQWCMRSIFLHPHQHYYLPLSIISTVVNLMIMKWYLWSWWFEERVREEGSGLPAMATTTMAGPVWGQGPRAWPSSTDFPGHKQEATRTQSSAGTTSGGRPAMPWHWHPEAFYFDAIVSRIFPLLFILFISRIQKLIFVCWSILENVPSAFENSSIIS